MRGVDEAARQVAGVRGLQRGVGETFAAAVGGDEVLEDRQAFAEVRDDRLLDDFADAAGQLLLRLGHQTAHAGQLPDLLARTAGAGVGHEEDRVEARLRRP